MNQVFTIFTNSLCFENNIDFCIEYCAKVIQIKYLSIESPELQVAKYILNNSKYLYFKKIDNNIHHKNYKYHIGIYKK